MKEKKCPIFPSPEPLTISLLFFDSMNLTILGFSYEWDHAVLVLL